MINLINSLFLVDKQAKDENMDKWQRLRLRLKYSEPIVRKLFKLLHLMKANIDDYGSLILTRMMKGDTNYMSMLPCNYVAQEHEDELKVKQCA